VSVTVDPAIACMLRTAFVLLFGGAVAHKLRAPREFRLALAGFGVLPARAVAPAAVLLVATELCIVVLLVVHPALGGAAAAMVLLAYGLVMAFAIARGRGGIECGCGGPAGSAPLQMGLVVRNVLLAAMALPLAGRVGVRALGWIDGLTILGALGSATALWAAVGVLFVTGPRIAELRRAAEAP
jgi:hypothetical protein